WIRRTNSPSPPEAARSRQVEAASNADAWPVVSCARDAALSVVARPTPLPAYVPASCSTPLASYSASWLSIEVAGWTRLPDVEGAAAGRAPSASRPSPVPTLGSTRAPTRIAAATPAAPPPQRNHAGAFRG